MGVFEHFPYANFHEMNLDWLLRAMKELDKKDDDLETLNSQLSERVAALEAAASVRVKRKVLELGTSGSSTGDLNNRVTVDPGFFEAGENIVIYDLIRQTGAITAEWIDVFNPADIDEYRIVQNVLPILKQDNSTGRAVLNLSCNSDGSESMSVYMLGGWPGESYKLAVTVIRV